MNISVRDGRRDRLVDCAKHAFATKGYYATSISNIVQDAGIARGTFYQYFDNKLHLFQSILDSCLQDLRDRIKPISIGPSSPHPLDQMHDNLARVLDLVLNDRELTQILLHQTSTLDDTVEAHLSDFYQQVAEMIERSLQHGIAMKLVRPCDPRLTAFSIIGAVKEVIYQLTSTPNAEVDVEQTVLELLAFGMRGILTEGQLNLLDTRYSGRNVPSPLQARSRT